MDYDDLLLQWGRLVREFPEERAGQARLFRHILIDEMQDTNAVQIEIVEAIAAAGAGNLTAVGDDAQSIYRFRGADYDNILRFPERHPGRRIFQLEVNYRSTPQIVALTQASIACNKVGFAKELESVPAERPASPGGGHEGCLRGGGSDLSADSRRPRPRGGTWADGRLVPQSSRQHLDSGRTALAEYSVYGSQWSAVFRASSHQGRAGPPADRAQPA